MSSQPQWPAANNLLLNLNEYTNTKCGVAIPVRKVLRRPGALSLIRGQQPGADLSGRLPSKRPNKSDINEYALRPGQKRSATCGSVVDVFFCYYDELLRFRSQAHAAALSLFLRLSKMITHTCAG